MSEPAWALFFLFAWTLLVCSFCWWICRRPKP